MSMLLSWLIWSGAIWVTAWLLPGFEVRGVKGAIVVAGVFGALNWLLHTPLYFLAGLGTLGIGFLLSWLTHTLINAVLFKLADALLDSLTIRKFWVALVGAAIASFLANLGNTFIN